DGLANCRVLLATRIGSLVSSKRKTSSDLIGLLIPQLTSDSPSLGTSYPIPELSTYNVVLSLGLFPGRDAGTLITKLQAG
ncbi:MAG: hypothetical protein ABIO91_01190, partial [Pyrinomonadaceae bacterium]